MSWNIVRQVFTAVWVTAMLLISVTPRAESAQLDNGRVFLSYVNVKLDMDRYNNRLIERGMIEFETSYNGIGVGFYSFIRDRWSVGGELNYLLDNKRRVGVYQSAVSGTYGGLNIGYLAYRIHGLNIQPQFGINGGSVNLDIEALTPQDPSSPLGEGRGKVKMSSVQASLSLMLAMDYLWIMRRSDDGTGYGLVLGTSIGYQFSPWQGDWESSGIELFDEPGIKLQGPQIRFSAGFGWGVE
ncbi:MAG: hypothetical protein FVQ81_11870 [Candidatus Glassbacteria bacterium]|nr:hypothetical protein [Candidatus Glassbacteria bacterium]